MTKKELKAVYIAISHARQTIEELCAENYPHTAFADDDFKNWFYDLNDMCLAMRDKIEAAQ